jgi:hypothetical protein
MFCIKSSVNNSIKVVKNEGCMTKHYDWLAILSSLAEVGLSCMRNGEKLWRENNLRNI